MHICEMLSLAAVEYQLKCCYDMKQSLLDTWSGMQQSVIDKAIVRWSKLFMACALTLTVTV